MKKLEDIGYELEPERGRVWFTIRGERIMGCSTLAPAAQQLISWVDTGALPYHDAFGNEKQK